MPVKDEADVHENMTLFVIYTRMTVNHLEHLVTERDDRTEREPPEQQPRSCIGVQGKAWKPGTHTRFQGKVWNRGFTHTVCMRTLTNMHVTLLA